MFAKESKRARHFVGRCERGEDLHAALLGLAVEHGIQAGWVRAIGAFECVELREYDQGTQAYRPAVLFDTPVEVLSLEGNLSSRDDQPFVHLHVTVSRETDNGVQVLGGHLERGLVFALEFHVQTFDDVALVRELDQATGLHLFAESTRSTPTGARPAAGREPALGPAPLPVVERVRERAPAPPDTVEPASRPSSTTPGSAGVTWAMAATASEEAQQAPLPSRSARPARPDRPSRRESAPRAPAHRPPPIADAAATDAHAVLFDEPIPEVGEYLDHRQFGICKIEQMNDDGGVMLRMPDKRKKLIKLDVLQVLEPRIEGNRIIYPVRPRGPRKA